jgi:hypothetical protein
MQAPTLMNTNGSTADGTFNPVMASPSWNRRRGTQPKLAGTDLE